MANRWEKLETVTDFIFLDSKITENGDCSHESKWHLLLGRKAMTNLHRVLERKSTLNTDWKDWCWSSNAFTKSKCTGKRSCCWERLRAGREGENRGKDGWMASPTQWTWVWADSGRQWKTRKPGVLRSTGVAKCLPPLRDWTVFHTCGFIYSPPDGSIYWLFNFKGGT